jgi:hypothetical protein
LQPPDRAPPSRDRDLSDQQRHNIGVYLAVQAARAHQTTPTLGDPSPNPLDPHGIQSATLREPRFKNSCVREASVTYFPQHDERGVAGFESYPSLTKTELHRADITVSPAQHGVWLSAAARSDNCLFLAETPVTALSYHQLHRTANAHTRYLSPGLEPSPQKLALVDRAIATLPPGSTVVIAVGRHPTRERLAAELSAHAARHPHVTVVRHAPDRAFGDDWNATLRRLQPNKDLSKGLQR